MMYKQDMFEAAGCRIMRCELQLLDLPGKLSEMMGKDPTGRRRQLFTEEDDAEIHRIPNARTEDNTLLPYFKDFCALKNRYSFSVPNYGSFALTSDGYLILEAVEKFNNELMELRRSVNAMLMQRYMRSWQNEYIRRFNPRIKCGLYLLTKCFISDESFIGQLGKLFEKEIAKGEMDIKWLLAPVDEELLKRKTVHLDPKADLRCQYILDHTDFS